MKKVVLTLIVLTVTAGMALADEETLLKKIEALEARVKYLEKRLEATGEAPAPPAAGKTPESGETPPAGRQPLEERVEKLEKQVGDTGGASDFRIYWKDGLCLDTRDGTVKMRFNGRLHNDWGWGFQSGGSKTALGDVEDSVEFRRLRLGVQGTFYDDLLFRMDFDFAGGNVNLKDAYLGMQNLPWVGTVLVGHMQEPFSMEELESTNYLTFIEHGLPHVFTPCRNVGVRANSTCFDERMTWAAGVFRDADDTGMHLADDGSSVTGRVTAVPVYSEDGRRVVHLGAAFSHRLPQDDQVRYRQRPEEHLAPYFVDTGTFVSERQELLGLESALVWGPLSLQGEYMRVWADRSAPNDDAQFEGYYFQASWLLTGEYRPYDRKNGVFGRVKPRRNFKPTEGGWGAWEVAGRYSFLDLNDSGLAGGEISDYTLGLNWYLHPNLRVMFNWIHSDVKDAADADLVGMRFQADF